jgi:hypothetical protein
MNIRAISTSSFSPITTPSISSTVRTESLLRVSRDGFERAPATTRAEPITKEAPKKSSKGRAIADAVIESFGWFGAGTAIAYPAVSAAAALSFGGLTGLGCLAYFGIKWALKGEIS